MKERIKCWVAISEANEFEVYCTRKQCVEGVKDFKNFDVIARIKKAVLIIDK